MRVLLASRRETLVRQTLSALFGDRETDYLRLQGSLANLDFCLETMVSASNIFESKDRRLALRYNLAIANDGN